MVIRMSKDMTDLVYVVMTRWPSASDIIDWAPIAPFDMH